MEQALPFKRPITVLKFGGTSLSNSERIARAGGIVRHRHLSGVATVVVVSAQATITDSLLAQAHELAPDPDLRELDLLLSSGERISAALFAIWLNGGGVPAIGLTGSQAGIITDTNHNRARIVEIRPFRVAQALEAGKVVVVGGFQGVSNHKEITTLGRGGSDITAVALAGALGAERCEIYSDVDGVYTGDPRVVANPLKLDEISHTEMEEFSRAGARVLHPEAVALARTRGLTIQARTSFLPHATGTIIQDIEQRQKARVLGVASIREISWVRVPGTGERLLRKLEAEQIHFTALWRARRGRTANWNVLIPARENAALGHFLSAFEQHLPGCRIVSKLCLVSLVGEGCGHSPAVLRRAQEALRPLHLNPFYLESRPHSIRFLLQEKDHDQVVAVLHDAFIARANFSPEIQAD